MTISPEVLAHLSPLQWEHINFLGRYAIASSAPAKGLRPLGTTPPSHDGAAMGVVGEDGPESPAR
ncbi:Tn3 family transposase [Streptosporangium sp. NPDC006013]|uniref:Tn3 family transposase n=1 Tax=unclassified Streptosporangium TaxID=2632669 RepID=UPI0033B639DF